MIRVTIWNEFVHERTQEHVKAIYPEGIHKCIGDFLAADDIRLRYATLDMPGQGLSEETLQDTDVLIWWGHMHHDEVTDENADMVARHVQQGMGLIALHSAHHSKPFRRLMGTSCNLRWRHGDRERVWCASPWHPIAKGLPEQFELPKEEMYGEAFDIPRPDDVVFMGWFSGGEVFRSGLTFTRGAGKIFYFQPGHEEYPVYKDENVQKVIKNAVRWVHQGREERCIIPVVMSERLEK